MIGKNWFQEIFEKSDSHSIDTYLASTYSPATAVTVTLHPIKIKTGNRVKIICVAKLYKG